MRQAITYAPMVTQISDVVYGVTGLQRVNIMSLCEKLSTFSECIVFCCVGCTMTDVEINVN